MSSEDIFDALFDNLSELDLHVENVVANEPAAMEYVDMTVGNLVDTQTRLDYMTSGNIESGSKLLSPICVTLNTVSGFIENVHFSERELIEIVSADHEIVMYKCNYGVKQYHGYSPPPKKQKKKSANANLRRKVQGDGTCFGTQITIHVISRNVDKYDGIVYSEDVLAYKFKLFRNGSVQISGILPNLVNDMYECGLLLVRRLNLYLHAADADFSSICRLASLKVVMKNYRGDVLLGDPRAILNFGLIIDIVENELVPHKLPVIDIKSPIHDSCISILFRVQGYKTRLNIYMRGKIGILSSPTNEITDLIREYLVSIIEYEGVIKVPPVPERSLYMVRYSEILQDIKINYLTMQCQKLQSQVHEMLK